MRSTQHRLPENLYLHSYVALSSATILNMQCNYHSSEQYPSSCLLFKTQLNSVGLSVPHSKHITSPLQAHTLMLSIGLWRLYINITITILDIILRPVFYLKLNSTQLYKFDRTSQETHYVSATSPTVNTIHTLYPKTGQSRCMHACFIELSTPCCYAACRCSWSLAWLAFLWQRHSVCFRYYGCSASRGMQGKAVCTVWPSLSAKVTCQQRRNS
jgi:hypothetical protein